MALSIKPAVPCSEGLVLRPEAHELASARLGQLRIECGQGHLDRACGGMWACAFGAVGAFGCTWAYTGLQQSCRGLDNYRSQILSHDS